MTVLGPKEKSSSKGPLALAERLEQGLLAPLELLKSRIGGMATRGVADLSELQALDGLAATALRELDGIMLQLPTADEDAPTPETPADFWVRLGELCGGFHSSSGLECRYLIPQGHTRLSTPVADILLRVIAELLSNVRRHACANSVEVSCTVRADGSMEFVVKDDGIGLASPERVRPLEDGAFGLWTIKHRLLEIGAFMELKNAEGLCARVVVPAPPTEAQ